MSGIKYLLDTNIIIGLCNRNQAVFDLLQTRQINDFSECAFSAITRMELLSYSEMTADDKTRLENFLSHMTYSPITRIIENETIEFKRFHKMKLPDSIIAATAKCHQLELITLDKRLVNKL